jgi:hypothetical protein
VARLAVARRELLGLLHTASGESSVSDGASWAEA